MHFDWPTPTSGCFSEEYLHPPQLESRELLALCLKRLRGLNKVRLVDAGFIWTEPHSKRIKAKLTIQKEVRFVLLVPTRQRA